MFQQKVIADIEKDKTNLLSFLNDDAAQLSTLLNMITKEGISEKTYAFVFQAIAYENLESENRYAYSAQEGHWMHNGKIISDMEVISAFSTAVKFIKRIFSMAWKICCIGAFNNAWINKAEYEKSCVALEEMESFDTLKRILDLAKNLMPAEESETAAVDWDAYPETEESDLEDEIP